MVQKLSATFSGNLFFSQIPFKGVLKLMTRARSLIGAYIWIQTKLSDIPDSEVKKSIQFYVAHHLRKIKKECGICPSRRLLEHSDQGTVHCVGYFLFYAKFFQSIFHKKIKFYHSYDRMGSTSHTDVQDWPRTWNCDDWRKWFKRLSCYKSRYFFLFHNLKWLNAIIFFIKHSIKPQNRHLDAKLI